MKERLSKLLHTKVADLQKLFGDASYRAYYRVRTEEGKTYVLMAMPEGKMSVSEEITNIKDKPKELPFINIQRYLQSIGMPVPKIILFSEADRWIVLEDVGDNKFFDVVAPAAGASTDSASILKWYKKAIDLLIELQQATSHEPRATNCIAFHRSYDATLFNWEFDHFWEYYFKIKNQKSKIKDEEANLFKKETEKITRELCALPKGFTHRDYQSRNLMVHNKQLVILDFQDALLGPKVYDVVCLLRDSYVDVTPHLETLLGYYCEKSEEDFKKFRRQFDLQTVQRKLKDAGRFVFIDKVKKNPNFLPYIPLSMDYVRQALARLPEYGKLRDVILNLSLSKGKNPGILR